MADTPSAPVPVIFHERKHLYPHDIDLHDQHRSLAKKLPVIPDLRFEYSYLRSVKPYVKVERVVLGTKRNENSAASLVSTGGVPDQQPSVHGGGKGREVTREGIRGPSEVITIQWGRMAWVTIRDQVISPLLQGLLWALASNYIKPFSKDFGTRMGTFVHETLPRKEGSVVSWLRGWTKSIGLSGLTTSNS